MTEEKRFEVKEELEEWLKSRGVDEDDASEAAQTLFAKGANKSTKLIGISSDQLERLGVPTLTSVELSIKLKEDQQQWVSQEAKLGLELMAQDYLTKKKTIALSDATDSAKNELLDMLHLPEKGVLWPNRPAVVLLPIDGFSWLNSSEDSAENRTACIAHLNEFLQLPKDYSLADVQPNRKLLTVELFKEMSQNQKIRGTTNVVIAKSEHILNRAVRNNIEALIELKKSKNLKSKDHTAQTADRHFAASYLNPKHAVVSVLTDLNNSWTLFWFAKEKDCADVALYTLHLENERAAGLAKYMLDSLYDTTSCREMFPITFVNRVSFETIIDSIGRGNNKRARRDFDDTGGDDGSSLPNPDSKPLSSLRGADRDCCASSGSGGGTAHQNN